MSNQKHKLSPELRDALEQLDDAFKKFPHCHSRTPVHGTVNKYRYKQPDNLIPADFDCTNPNNNPFHVRKEV